MAHASPVTSNNEYLSDQESKPSEFGSEKSLSSVKSTVGLVTPKIEPIPYYPNTASTSAQHIKDIKPAVSNSSTLCTYKNKLKFFRKASGTPRNRQTSCYAIFTPHSVFLPLCRNFFTFYTNNNNTNFFYI